MQSTMARAALKMSRSELSLLAGVKYTALIAFEGGKQVEPETVSVLKQTLEGHGAVFIDEPGKIGVVLRTLQPANV